MEEQPNCRVCSSEDTDFLMTTSPGLTKVESIVHRRCRKCGSVFVSSALDQDDLAEAYSSVGWEQYYRENYETNKAKFQKGVEFLRSASVPADAKILDIGGGNGMFAQLLTEAGYRHVSVHEIPGAEVKADSVESVFQDFDYGSIADESFDVVTMMDVFEHVPDPDFLVATCRRILKPNGILYFHTPAVTPIDRVMHVLLKVPLMSAVGKTWARGRTSVFHLENYTKRAFELLFKERFQLVSMEFKNELSWPVASYVRIYLTSRLRLPDWTSLLLAPLCHPFIATNLLNPNKAVVHARRIA